MLLLFYKFFAIIYIENKERGVKAMRTYHPASWSQRAREMANVQFRQVIYYTYIHPEKWTLERTPEETAIELFNTSYRHSLIRERAAKRFGRLMREYKRKRGL